MSVLSEQCQGGAGGWAGEIVFILFVISQSDGQHRGATAALIRHIHHCSEHRHK